MSGRIEFQDERFRRPIRQLDQVLINKIAAGEVIERPASVVKELTENAFDAGATAIDIIARKAGTTFISVVDNGCGIRADQVRLAFSRHATSKIESLDELFAVHSFGFRGEALPSIASVSHLALTTRHYSEEQGTTIIFEGGREISCRPAAAPVGTKIEVSHLFFNTPARRKFLKAETTESRQIVRVAERMALGRPSAAVSLTLNDRETFRLPPDQPVADRMASLFGVRSDSIVEYNVELDGVSFLVYLAHPEQARNDRTRICLFINGRSVTSSTIIHAVTSGYGELLPGGRYPLASIYITVDPARLDVNVHPTKAEVRLAEESHIHDNLYRIINKALRNWRLIPSQGSPVVENQRDNVQDGRSTFVGGPDRFRPPRSTGFPGHMPPHSGTLPFPRAAGEMPHAASEVDVSSACEFQGLAEPVDRPSTPTGDAPAGDQIAYLGRAGQTYVLITIADELYIVDQHAAHERVIYEEVLRQFASGGGVSQKILFPETVQLSSDEFLLFEECQALLSTLGFDVAPFGKNAVIIQGLPGVLTGKDPKGVLQKILEDTAAMNKAGGDMTKSIAQSMACRAAVMAGDCLSEREALYLIRRLLAANNPYCCPHGRPTFIKIGREELDGRFGRR